MGVGKKYRWVHLSPRKLVREGREEAGQMAMEPNRSLWYLDPCPSILQVNHFPRQYSILWPYALFAEVWLSGGRGRWLPEGPGEVGGPAQF